MHLDERITEVSTCGSEAMKHIVESPVTAIVTEIDPEHLIEWQLWNRFVSKHQTQNESN